MWLKMYIKILVTFIGNIFSYEPLFLSNESGVIVENNLLLTPIGGVSASSESSYQKLGSILNVMVKFRNTILTYQNYQKYVDLN